MSGCDRGRHRRAVDGARHRGRGGRLVSADAQSDTERVQRNIADVINKVKDSGAVIVGRDATVILARREGALHVHLQAPVRTHIARAAGASRISLGVATRRQQREDRVRTQMSQRLMQWDPADVSHHDIVIDTGDVSLDEAVDRIVGELGQPTVSPRSRGHG
jgi:glucuronide carrier protein